MRVFAALAHRYAAMHIERTLKTHAEALADKSKLDQEVLERDEISKRKAKIYREVTEWSVLPTLDKRLLQASVACMGLSLYVFNLASCFESFELTDTVSCHLKGHGHKFVLLPGWVGLGLFAVSGAFFQIFTKRAGSMTAAREKTNPPVEDGAAIAPAPSRERLPSTSS